MLISVKIHRANIIEVIILISYLRLNIVRKNGLTFFRENILNEPSSYARTCSNYMNDQISTSIKNMLSYLCKITALSITQAILLLKSP